MIGVVSTIAVAGFAIGFVIALVVVFAPWR
jgi:tetrahydromethanopterin S-methyltransferase subunit F